MRKYFLSVLFISVFYFSYSQELNCRISVNYSRIQGTNTAIFQALQRDLYEFMNNRKWTNNIFSVNERIECQIMINLSDFNGIDQFSGTISVQSSRTIFNSNYKSTLLNHKEKDNSLVFTYIDGQALDFNENTHISNLTSVLAYYAYIIIGLDYDSYSKMSGTPYFQKAQQIVSNAQSAPEPGWKPFESGEETNRYYLVEHILSSDNVLLRDLYYNYHRKGLDTMSEQAEKGRSAITNAITNMQRVFKRKPDSYFLKIIMTTKTGEIINIYSEAPQLERTKIYNILKEIDPSSSKLEELKQNR